MLPYLSLPGAPASARHNQSMTQRIILLHGWACSSGYWAPLSGRLSAAGYEVSSPDLPGYGSDPRAGFDWTVENVAADLAERCGNHPAHWVGHSLGGNIAATIAARFPRTTASLTLIGMVPVAPSAATVDKLTRLFGGAAFDAAVPESGVAAGEELIAAWFRGRNEPQGKDRETFLAPFRRSPDVVRQSLAAGLAGAAPEVPNLVAAPTLVVTGTGDSTRPPAAVTGFLSRHSGWQHTTVPEAGHMVHWEAPAACADAILRHVANAEQGTA